MRRGVSAHCFVDARASQVTLPPGTARPGFSSLSNRAPIIWRSKHQKWVKIQHLWIRDCCAQECEVALRDCGVSCACLESHWDQLTHSVTMKLPPRELFDPQNRPSRKKHTSIARHRNREATAAGTVRIAKEDSAINLADVHQVDVGAAKKSIV